MLNDVELVVPSRDGFPYVFVIAREYVRLALRPLYFIDNRSARLYRFLAKVMLSRSVTFPGGGKGEFIEAFLPDIVDQSAARWVFRLDDDEAPSTAFVKWLREVVEKCPKTVIAVPRRAVRFEDGECVYARTLPLVDPYDYQYRGFVRGAVGYDLQLHTPGIEFKISDVLYAPEDCCIYHFDWIVKNRSEREAKQYKYNRIRSGSWDLFKQQYLPEDFGSSDYNYASVQDPRKACKPSEDRKAMGVTS